jgi:hypothetical protein
MPYGRSQHGTHGGCMLGPRVHRSHAISDPAATTVTTQLHPVYGLGRPRDVAALIACPCGPASGS